MDTIDLFAGAGGFSTGAQQAGATIRWAGNHWPLAVHYHTENHPETAHGCEDLHRTDWTRVPDADIILAAPCCQGHSRARGKANGDPQHDASRGTAFAVVDALAAKRPQAFIVENVPDFMKWDLYEAWLGMVAACGYAVQPHLVNAADHGTPQDRERLLLVGTRSAAPLTLRMERTERIPASTFIDFASGAWSPVERPGRSAATLARVCAGRHAHGDRFLAPYYKSGSGTTGRSLDRPIGTITTRARWAVIDGDRMRMLTVDETRKASGFPDGYKLPAVAKDAIHLLGNAIPPPLARAAVKALIQQL